MRNHSLTRQLLHECMAMADYAFDSGLRISSKTAENLQMVAGHVKNWDARNKELEKPERLDERIYAPLLSEIHSTLATTVAPSTPRAILLLFDTKGAGSIKFGGAVPLVKRMRLTALWSLAFMIIWSLFPQVDGRPDSYSLVLSYGSRLALNYLFFLSAASLGACFSALYIANGYVKNGTFDDLYESTYWTRYVLGLMAGILMAVVIPVEAILGQNETVIPQGFGPPVLALLGGFAASFVYRLMDKIVKMLETSVRGDLSSEVAAREMEALSRLEDKAMQDRLDQSRLLAELQRDLVAGMTPSELEQTLKEMQGRLLEEGSPRL